VVTVFLVVIELGHRALGKVFLYPVKVVAHCNCGAPQVLVIDGADEYNDDYRCCFFYTLFNRD
jgi:hypothetical protein